MFNLNMIFGMENGRILCRIFGMISCVAGETFLLFFFSFILCTTYTLETEGLSPEWQDNILTQSGSDFFKVCEVRVFN
jgi:hypothetical protein